MERLTFEHKNNDLSLGACKTEPQYYQCFSYSPHYSQQFLEDLCEQGRRQLLTFGGAILCLTRYVPYQLSTRGGQFCDFKLHKIDIEALWGKIENGDNYWPVKLFTV